MNCRLVACVLLLLGLFAVDRPAAGYPAHWRWHTITTRHFRVHFHEGLEPLARQTARLAEEIHPILTRRYRWAPHGRTEIVVEDSSDRANGSATVVPYRTIHVLTTAPRHGALADQDDWLRQLLVHEYTHIIHMDMAFGLPWLGRLIFGNNVSPNGLWPQWMTEGLAIYEETAASRDGRGRSAYADMVLRMAALEDGFFPLDRAHLYYGRWPGGGAAYYLGIGFARYLAENFGQEALVEVNRAYASQVIPFLATPASYKAFGAYLPQIWKRWWQGLEERYRTQQAAVCSPACTAVERLTDEGGDLGGPRYGPDGSLAYSRANPAGRWIGRLRPDGRDERLVDDFYAPSLAWEGDRVLFERITPNRHVTYADPYRYSPADDRLERLRPVDTATLAEDSLRAVDLDSANGRLVFVRLAGGRSSVVVAEIGQEGLRLTTLLPPQEGVEYAAPRFSPDGERIALAVWHRGLGWDVEVVDHDGCLVERITEDRAMDGDPAWSPDGRYLLFSSDRDGIFNLYAHDTRSGRRYRVTRVLGGAFSPDVAPDGRRIAFRGYNSRGFDIYTLPFAPSTWTEERELVAEGGSDHSWPERLTWAAEEADQRYVYYPWPAEPLPVVAPASATTTAAVDLPGVDMIPEEVAEDGGTEGTESLTVEPYSPWQTLLPSRERWNLMPGFSWSGDDLYLSLSHGGQDVLGQHAYRITGGIGTLTGTPDWAFGYENRRWEPILSVGAAAYSRLYPARAITYSAPDEPLRWHDDGDYLERRYQLSAGWTLPLYYYHYVTARYLFEYRRAQDDLPGTIVRGYLPSEGNYSRLGLGYGYSHVYRYAGSISPENGRAFSLAADLHADWLGGSREAVLLTGDYREYVHIPGIDNGVVALRLAGGMSLGPDRVESFDLGGTVSQSAISAATATWYALRGFPLGAYGGDSLLVGSIEARLPLLRPERGLHLVPAYLQAIHGALFLDGGNAFDREAIDRAGVVDGLGLGVGMELRADIVLAWAIKLTGRVGWAYAVRDPRQVGFREAVKGLYFQLGTPF